MIMYTGDCLIDYFGIFNLLTVVFTAVDYMNDSYFDWHLPQQVSYFEIVNSMIAESTVLVSHD